MRNNAFFIIICFLIIYANIATSNGKDDVENITEFRDVRKEFSEKLETSTNESMDNNGTCETDLDCWFRGKCEGNKGEKFCRCYEGSSGEDCFTTDECVKNPHKCGDGTDVVCRYQHFHSEKVDCFCLNETKRFDLPLKKCVDQKQCIEEKQCLNGGVCRARVDPRTKYCNCEVGTSGDFCERIEECINKPTLCGNGTDVKCEFNFNYYRAYCQCQNPDLRFDLLQKKCVQREWCYRSDDCQHFGRCTDECQNYESCYDDSHIEERKSCHCYEGTSGEKCEIVDDCYNKVVDCGSGDNVVCRFHYFSGLSADAYCECKNKKQSFDSVAKLCIDCDCDAGSCSFDKGQKICSCGELSYNFGDRCEDCKCGEGSNGCSFKGGPKKCFCNSGFLEGNGTCEKCNCGKNSTDCKSLNGKKVCICEPGFTEGNYGVCTPMCNDTHKCANGGLCLQDVCVCLAGTGGPYCETVYDCKSNMCGNHQNVSCEYDTEKQRAFCQCQHWNAVFDTFDETCKRCDCVTYSELKSATESCEFVRGRKVCHCKKGYAHRPYFDRCYRCDCGPNSTSCNFNEQRKEVCGCEDGFVELRGRCEECDCGRNGVCRYIEDSAKYFKMCTCDKGYEDYKGTCFKCDCGPNGKCIYSSTGKTLNCSCEAGYAEDTGKCKLCDCGPDSNCFFKSKQKYCQCPTGFESVRGYCRDIDECLNTESCPETISLCVNTIGSFKCECKPGFILQESNASENTSLCRKQEYFWFEKKEETAPNYGPWKIGYGIISAGFVAIIIGLVIIIFRIRRNINTGNTQAHELSVTYSRLHTNLS